MPFAIEFVFSLPELAAAADMRWFAAGLMQDLSEIQRISDDLKSQSGVQSSRERPQILTMPQILIS